MSNYAIKFNRKSGVAVAEVLNRFSGELENCNEKMLVALANLHDYYADEDYDAHEANIAAIISAMKELCGGIKDTANAILAYTNSLFD